MLAEQLLKDWLAREKSSHVHEFPRFEVEGLLLGADTVLVGPQPETVESRLEALLAVAYGQPPTRDTLRHVKAAADLWAQGCEARASLHLALARLGRLRPPGDAARRLFMADGLMRAGVAPRVIIDAIGLASAAGAPILKYSPDQPRVPAGQGRASGQWTAGGGGTTTLATAAVAAGAASGGRIGLDWLGGSLERVLAALAFIGRLARWVALGDLAAPVAGFGLLFWPSRAGPKAQWVDVGGPAQLRYYWSPDETLIRIQYRDASGGTRITTGRLGPGGEFRDPDGRPIARWIKAIEVVVQLASLEAIANADFEPRLCPKPPVPDRQGARKADSDYEDFVKRSVNPQNPTPRGLGYALPNPTSMGRWTVFDDCRQSDGAMLEAKNNYAGLIERLGGTREFRPRQRVA